MSDLTERLRENWEMLKDGYQENLTKTWHNHAMTNAAGDCAEAANELEAQEARLASTASALASAKDELYYMAHSSSDPDDPSNMEGLACAYRECRDALEALTPSLPK